MNITSQEGQDSNRPGFSWLSLLKPKKAKDSDQESNRRLSNLACQLVKSEKLFPFSTWIKQVQTPSKGLREKLVHYGYALPLSSWIKGIIDKSYSTEMSPLAKAQNILRNEDLNLLIKLVQELKNDAKHLDKTQLKEKINDYIHEIIDQAFENDHDKIDEEYELFTTNVRDIVNKKTAIRKYQLSRDKLKTTSLEQYQFSDKKAKRPKIGMHKHNRKEKIDHSKASFSEFGVVHRAHKFGTEKRNMDLVTNFSPGPAAYSPKTTECTVSSSFALKSSPRQTFMKLCDSPGPGTYNPTKLFVSKFIN